MTAERPGPQASQRSLVLVAGSGRSGTSLFSGILQRLGYHVPQPEVPADSTNPRGFAESQWVVDFHTRLLAKAGVHVSDARPAAWGHTADVALDDGVHDELARWLRKQFKASDHVLIKDPRLCWFLPLWRRCAEEAGVSPRYATVLRHPAVVIESKVRSYGGWQSDVNRTAGWLNLTLFTERATRDGARVFVRYEDLLNDWTKTLGWVGETLDLSIVRDAPAASIVSTHEFVDRGLSRSKANWKDFAIPTKLREQIDVVWDLVSQLANGDVEDMGTLAQGARGGPRRIHLTLRRLGGDRAVLHRRARREELGRRHAPAPRRQGTPWRAGKTSSQLAQGRLPGEARRREALIRARRSEPTRAAPRLCRALPRPRFPRVIARAGRRGRARCGGSCAAPAP